MSSSDGDTDTAIHDRLQAAQCLKNAHGHIATAYAQIQGPLESPARTERCVSETLDAVDWIRRALELLGGMRGSQ